MDIKKHKGWLIAAAVVVVILLWAGSVYNSLVSQEEAVGNQWADVETQYQRRADLVPNLVATVKGYAAHEQQTLEAVVKARSEATQTHIDAADLTPEKMAAYQKAQSNLSGALGRLLMVQENYPELKANENFLDLQTQLEGTENRISVARRDFNAVARTYNVAIRRFPNNIFASLFGFSAKSYFEAEKGAEKAPEVKF